MQPPAPTAVDPAQFRSVLGRFASGVTVVTMRDAHGTDHGMTVSAFSSVSLEPPLVLVCIDHAASLHALVSDAAHFGVNVLEASQETLSRRFAGDVDDRFDGVAYSRGASGVALLDGTLATLECKVVARHAAGDHTILVGEVETADARDGAPLLYFRSGYARLTR